MAAGYDFPFSLPMVAGAGSTEEVGKGVVLGKSTHKYPPNPKALVWEEACPQVDG